jgi:hypothetical protein
MPSFEMLHCVALVTANISEEHITFAIMATRISKLETTLDLADSCHPDDGGDTFLQNVDSYKNHMA